MTGKHQSESYKCEADSLNKRLRFQGLWRVIAFMNIGIVIILSLIPSPEDMMQGFGLDKVLHILAYLFCMFWCSMCYQGKKYIVLFFGGLILMGIALEIVQGGLGYRMMSTYDMVANSIGVFLGWVLARTRLSTLLLFVEKRFTT